MQRVGNLIRITRANLFIYTLTSNFDHSRVSNFDYSSALDNFQNYDYFQDQNYEDISLTQRKGDVIKVLDKFKNNFIDNSVKTDEILQRTKRNWIQLLFQPILNIVFL